MSQSITLTVPTTCTQDWSAMQPVLDGRHCGSCQSVVHDFTQFSDAELVAWFANHTGPACGRLRSDQLNLPIYDNQPAVPTGVRGWVRWVVALVLGWQTARAQNAPTVRTPTRQMVVPINSKESTGTPDSVLFYVRGQVVHADGKPAAIRIKKGQDQTLFFPDSTGHFQIPIYLSDQHHDVLLLTFDNLIQRTVSTSSEQVPLLIKLPVFLPAGVKVSVGGVRIIRP